MPSNEELQQAAVQTLDGSRVTLTSLALAVAVVAAAWLLAFILTRVLRRLRERSGRSARALYVLEKIAGYLIIVLGLFAGLSTAGLNMSSLAVFAGALGIGVGLGLQGVVKEFVSGLILIFDKMLDIGDYIELDGGARGLVQEIGPRATRIRTNDNVNVVVPNSHLIENAVTNWTLRGDTRRIHIPFSVAYGADRHKVREAVLACANASPFTLPETETRKTQVWLVGFGDSGLEFELVLWPTPDAAKRPAAMRAAYTWSIADALEDAGIEVPFPQTDLRIRSLFGQEGEAALETLGLRKKAPARKASDDKPARRRGPRKVNDAEQDLLHAPEQDAEAQAEEAAAEAERREGEKG